jgi:hypothetical protein
MDGLINKTILIIISLATVFLLSATILMPFFNTTYNYTVTGLSTATTQGILLLVFFLGLISIALYYLPRFKK